LRLIQAQAKCSLLKRGSNQSPLLKAGISGQSFERVLCHVAICPCALPHRDLFIVIGREMGAPIEILPRFQEIEKTQNPF
jgi:hypothetical protein